jgi:hypothetical protein
MKNLVVLMKIYTFASEIIIKVNNSSKNILPIEKDSTS